MLRSLAAGSGWVRHTNSPSQSFAKFDPRGGALSTCTYGEVSPIFLGQNVAKNDIFGSK